MAVEKIVKEFAQCRADLLSIGEALADVGKALQEAAVLGAMVLETVPVHLPDLIKQQPGLGCG